MHGWAASMQLIWFHPPLHILSVPSFTSTFCIRIKLVPSGVQRFYSSSRITLIFEIFTRGLDSTRTFKITLYAYTDGIEMQVSNKSMGRTTTTKAPLLLTWTKNIWTIPLHSTPLHSTIPSTLHSYKYSHTQIHKHQ